MGDIVDFQGKICDRDVSKMGNTGSIHIHTVRVSGQIWAIFTQSSYTIKGICLNKRMIIIVVDIQYSHLGPL